MTTPYNNGSYHDAQQSDHVPGSFPASTEHGQAWYPTRQDEPRHPASNRYAAPHGTGSPPNPQRQASRVIGGVPIAPLPPPTTPKLDNLLAEIQETIDGTRTPSPPAAAQPSSGFAASMGSTSPPHTASGPFYDAMSSPPSRPYQSGSHPASPDLHRTPRGSSAHHDASSHVRPLPTPPKSQLEASPPVPGRSSSYGADPNRPVQRNQTTGARYAGSGEQRRVPSAGENRPPPITSVSAPGVPMHPVHALAPVDETQYATYGGDRPAPTANGMRSPGRSQTGAPSSFAPETHGPRRAISDVGSGAGRRPNLQPSDSLLARAAFNVRAHDPALEYLQPWLLSHIATFFRDRVRKTTNVKGSIEYPFSFTGREAVTTVQTTFPARLSSDRKLALRIARTLLRELFFHEVDWAETVLQDNVEDVYVFTEDEQAWGSGEHPPAASSSLGLMGAGQDQPGATPVPNGVLTPLTTCYSPYCTRETKDGRAVGGCYSRFCPNSARPSLERANSSMSTLSSEAAAPTQTTWDSTVPKELLTTLDKNEIARQCVIFEIISGEQEFVDDLELYNEHFIRPIRNANPPIIPPDRVEGFLTLVASESMQLLDHNRALLEGMRVRQREQHPIVQAVGDLVLQAALEWGPLFVKVIADGVMGEAEVNEEKLVNPALAGLLADLPRKTARRSDFRHFLLRAGARLMRYPLLLEQIVKKTPEGNPDVQSCKDALEIIRAQCKQANEATSQQQTKLAIRNLRAELIGKADTPDLQLLDPTRWLYKTGKVTRRPDGAATTGLVEWIDLNVWLLDHYFIMAKSKRTDDGSTRYTISRRPVPLELLRVSGWSDPPERKSRGLRTVTGLVERNASDPYTHPPGGPGTDDRIVFPITITALGRNGGTVTLCVESDKARLEWKAKFEEAIGMQMARLEATRVFELSAMCDKHFGGDLEAINGTPTCSVPFTAADGRSLVAIGSPTGLWIGLRHDPASLKRVLQLKGITQCAVLQDFNFIIVLAEKVLIAYPLESLVPTRNSDTASKQGPSRLSGNKDVIFFRCGKVGPRTLVIYVKKGGVNQTVFKALEPVGTVDRPSKGGGRHGFFGFGGQKSEDFRGYKEFFVPAEAYAIQYMRSKLTIHCARGFELMDLDTLRTASIPDFSLIRADGRTTYALQRRCEESRPLGMFRVGTQGKIGVFLLCYSDFAFFADNKGDPMKDRWDDLIEWEGSPTSVAYSHPYIIAFSPSLFEVWDASTSKRVQIEVGTNIACTYDGGNVGDDPAPQPSGSRSQDDGSRRVHVSMRGQDRYMRVFELVPTGVNPANGHGG